MDTGACRGPWDAHRTLCRASLIWRWRRKVGDGDEWNCWNLGLA
jgi:hypothetical protein